MSDDFTKFLEGIFGKVFGKKVRVIPVQLGPDFFRCPMMDRSKLEQEIERVEAEIQQKIRVWGVPQEYRFAVNEMMWGAIDILVSNFRILQLGCFCRDKLEGVSQNLDEIYKLLLTSSGRCIASLCSFMKDVPCEDIAHFIEEKFHEVDQAIALADQE